MIFNKEKSIKYKVTFLFVLVVLVCASLFGLISSMSLTSISDQQIKMTEIQLKKSVVNSMKDAGSLAGERVSKLLKESFTPTAVLSEIFTQTANTAHLFEREQIKLMGKDALNSSKTISALYIQFEPNGYDNKDDEFANSGKDHSTSIGTLETYWIKENGDAVYYPDEDPSDKYAATPDENGVREAEWYLCSFDSLKPCALDPYLYEIEPGRKELMTTLTSPIVIGGEFKGLVGVDINLPVVQQWIVEQAGKLFDGKSSISLLSQKNLFVASSKYPDSLSKEVSKVSKGLYEVIKNSDDTIIDGSDWYVKIPIVIEEAGVTWTLVVSVPESVAFASITKMKVAAKEMYDGVIAELILFSVLFLAGAVFFAVLLAKSIASPIKVVSSSIQNLAEQEGDLTQTVKIESHEELILLASGFNKFIHKLAEMISASKHYSIELVGQFSNLSRIAKQVEVDTQTQMSELDNIATAMTEMSATATEVAQLAASTADGGHNANQLLSETQEILNSSVEEVTKLEESMVLTSEQISQVAVRTSDITSIVETIRSIAEQTNLLALNAAIEAARAGEQGRGFAVVADEVRNLAGRTQTSTEDISRLIGNLQNDVDKAVSNLEGIKGAVSETVGKTSDSYERLSSTMDSISQINDSSAQVATAAEEQSHVAEDINMRLVSVTDSSRALADMGNELSATSQTSKELVSSMEQQLSRLKC